MPTFPQVHPTTPIQEKLSTAKVEHQAHIVTLLDHEVCTMATQYTYNDFVKRFFPEHHQFCFEFKDKVLGKASKDLEDFDYNHNSERRLYDLLVSLCITARFFHAYRL